MQFRSSEVCVEMTIQIKINQMTIAVSEGQFVLEVARNAGFDIPSLCHHDAVEPIGACRICLVEQKIGHESVLTTACNLVVQEGMEIFTDSAEIRAHRAANLELLLARAPGSKKLRELASKYGINEPRHPPIQDNYPKDCILCELCVRVCSNLGHKALAVLGRGDRKRIGLPFNQPSETCVGCGSCRSVCPTDCIFMRDTPETRTIWGKTHRFVTCKQCSAPIMTYEHRAFAVANNGLGEDYYDVCESCKQVAASRRFASVVW